MPPAAVYVGRPSRWGNPWFVMRHGAVWLVKSCASPYIVRTQDRDKALMFAVHMYCDALMLGLLQIDLIDVVRELRGRDLACWCPLPKPGEPDICHGAVLLAVANEELASHA